MKKDAYSYCQAKLLLDTGKILEEEFLQRTSIIPDLFKDFNKEKIKGTIYFERVKNDNKFRKN